MKLSVAISKSKFKPMNVVGLKALSSLIKRHTWSCGVFKDNHRVAKNFQFAETIALDFDGGMNLEQAMSEFAEYKHVIATTKSHDEFGEHRFRVVLFLEKPIIDYNEYQTTVRSLLSRYPQADKNCSDAARMWYKSVNIVSSKETGLTIPVVTTTPPPKKSTSKSNSTPLNGLDFSRKPPGWSNCKWSIANGYFEKGEGNEMMLALCTSLKKLNYTKTQAYHICKDALQLREERTGNAYDSNELWRTIIEVVYGESWQGAEYVCSKEDTKLHDYCQSLGVNSCPKKQTAFNFVKVGDLLKSNPKVDYLVDGLLTKGGISIIAGPPKSGKSTIIRQLVKSVSRGQYFLDRKTEPGEVIYLALEEQPQLLNEQFKRVGINENDNILLQIGGVLSSNAFEELTDLLMEKRPALMVIDTLLLLANVKDANNYNEMNDVLAKYRDLARKSSTHILCVHHQNKTPPGMSTKGRDANSILGSAAIHGAMDCAMIFNKEREKRYISTSQRGGKPFIAQELEFNPENETYSIKMGNSDDQF